MSILTSVFCLLLWQKGPKEPILEEVELDFRPMEECEEQSERDERELEESEDAVPEAKKETEGKEGKGLA